MPEEHREPLNAGATGFQNVTAHQSGRDYKIRADLELPPRFP